MKNTNKHNFSGNNLCGAFYVNVYAMCVFLIEYWMQLFYNLEVLLLIQTDSYLKDDDDDKDYYLKNCNSG